MKNPNGFRLHPLKLDREHCKEPQLKNWPERATFDHAQIPEWTSTGRNFGVDARNTDCIVESDNVSELPNEVQRQLPRMNDVEVEE